MVLFDHSSLLHLSSPPCPHSSYGPRQIPQPCTHTVVSRPLVQHDARPGQGRRQGPTPLALPMMKNGSLPHVPIWSTTDEPPRTSYQRYGTEPCLLVP